MSCSDDSNLGHKESNSSNGPNGSLHDDPNANEVALIILMA